MDISSKIKELSTHTGFDISIDIYFDSIQSKFVCKISEGYTVSHKLVKKYNYFRNATLEESLIQAEEYIVINGLYNY